MNFSLRNINKTWSSEEREKNTVRLHIDICTICDNNCEYCYSRAEVENWGLIMSSSYVENTLIPNLLSLADALNEQNKFLDIVLLGGEPTLHPMFTKILLVLVQKSNVRFSITSNGNRQYNKTELYQSLHSKVRWAFTYHQSQVSDVDMWLSKIFSNSYYWWEVAVSPLIDCLGNIEENARRVKYVIDKCHERGIKVQPVFQFNPFDKVSHIDMTEVVKYYSFLEDEFPIYQYDNEYLNDYTILKSKKNYLKGCMCINNNVGLNVRGDLIGSCNNVIYNWSDLKNLNTTISCPLEECDCYGFLSLYKKS